MTKFNDRLSQAHRGSDMSQEATVAAIQRVTGAKIPQTTFSGYLRETEPDTSNMAAIAQFYNVSLEWLAGMTDDRRPYDYILNRLGELSFSRDVESAAKILALMPEDERAEICSMIAARYRQWETMNSLIKIVEKFDSDGSIARRVKELSGLDLGGGNAGGNLGGDNTFGNGNLNSTSEQLALIS